MIWKGQDIRNRVWRTEKKFTKLFSCVYLKNAIVALQEHMQIKYLYQLYFIHPFRAEFLLICAGKLSLFLFIY